MVYDSANDVMLVFRAQNNGVGVWVYHIRQNRWEALPEANPSPANGKIWDAAYDERNNVTVVSGTSVSGSSATPNSRQTWTYRYRTPEQAPQILRSPDEVTCVVNAEGSVVVRWKPGAAASYRIERGAAAQPWLAQWEKAGEVSGATGEFTDAARPKTLTFYRVVAIGADGHAAPAGLPARTAPRMLSQVTAMLGADGAVQVRWQASREADVVGYHLYRSPVELPAPWSKRVSVESLGATLTRVTDKPLTTPAYTDATARVEGTANELAWPKTFAYVVRPVNAWGIEGGASPITLALPDPPGPMESVPWADGRRLVLWSSCLGGDVPGYSVMRMDDWDARHVFRLHAAPLATAGCWDGDNFPTGDRRLYHVSGVDAIGTVGIPSSPVWSHGFP